MKNIHILPTDKPSRLYSYKNRLGIANKFQCGSDTVLNKNIYITNSEEIKEEDWFLCLDNGKCNDSIYKANEAWLNMEEKQPSYCKKIILTTDLELQKDGVQAIDDEFLEWFVKNPSCEEVEVKREKAIGYAGDRQRTFYGKYKIIIPKEEPKQETLEEIAEIFVKNRFAKQICNDESYPDIYASKFAIVESHILFAKWQQQNSYSEEEIIDLLLARDIELNSFGGIDKAKEWFEQFKKK